MTARVIPIQRQTGRGRQPAIVERLRDDRDELVALTAEAIDLAGRLVVISRRAQVRLARGISPADLLDDIERMALRYGIQATAAAAALRADDVCPDGADVRHSGHGAAA